MLSLTLTRIACVALAVVISNPAVAHAQSSTNSVGRTDKGWRTRIAIAVGAEYDDNVFLLPPLRKNDVQSPSAGETVSGRYANMESPSDIITTLTAGLGIKGAGVLGRTLTFTPELTYSLYAQNSERSHATARLSLEQSVARGGRLRLRARMTPSYFSKNYLVDAVDRDGSRTISDAERVYERGEYRETAFGGDYRFRLSNSTRQHPFGASLQFGGGYYDRVYDAPHEGRDLAGPTADAVLRLALNRRVRVDASYDFEALSATPTEQILLLDEADFARDFNGNGTSTDLDVRVSSLVDRSRTEQTVGGALAIEIGPRLDLTMGYDHRRRRFSSDQPLDVSYRGRRDARDQVAADLTVRLSRSVRMRMGGGWSTQKLNRESDAGGTEEIGDYRKYQARIGLLVGR